MRLSENKSPESRYWMQRAIAVRRKLNAGWWADRCGPLFVLSGIAVFAGLFYVRSIGWQVQTWQGGVVGLAGLALVSIAALIAARNKFCTTEQALIRLESKLRLHNALSTAAAGVGPWPDASLQQGHESGAGVVHWRVSRILGPLVAYLTLITVGLFVPVFADDQTLPMNEPMGWSEMEGTLETLEQEQVVEPASLEKMREQIRELRNQPGDEWYSHSSMEATDHLEKNLDASVQDMANDLADAERALDTLGNHLNELSESARDKALGDYEAAVQGLERNGLELNEELMEKLQALDPSQLNQLDKEQIDELRERLRSASST